MTPPQEMTPTQAREAFRAGLRVPTSGYCRGWTQANLISLPREYAYDFLLFAQRNPQPCPVLEVTEPGETSAGIFAGDLRTDLPAYRVYRDGELVEERTDVTAVPACGVVTEHMVALVLADEATRKFGGDSIDELTRNHRSFLDALAAGPVGA